MLESLKLLIDAGALTCFCFCGHDVLKFLVCLLICLFPNLSDEKVNAITRMISKGSKNFKI